MSFSGSIPAASSCAALRSTRSRSTPDPGRRSARADRRPRRTLRGLPAAAPTDAAHPGSCRDAVESAVGWASERTRGLPALLCEGTGYGCRSRRAAVRMPSLFPRRPRPQGRGVPGPSLVGNLISTATLGIDGPHRSHGEPVAGPHAGFRSRLHPLEASVRILPVLTMNTEAVTPGGRRARSPAAQPGPGLRSVSIDRVQLDGNLVADAGAGPSRAMKSRPGCRTAPPASTRPVFSANSSSVSQAVDLELAGVGRPGPRRRRRTHRRSRRQALRPGPRS